MYKAVFIDIDGTLIKSDHSISNATFETIQKLKKKNILVALVSARPLHGILPIADEIGLQNFPLASLNGACIAIDEKIVFESMIDAGIIARLHEQLQQYNVTTIYYQGMQWFAETQNFYSDYEQKITAIPITIEPFAHILKHWQNENSGPNKILVIAEAAETN